MSGLLCPPRQPKVWRYKGGVNLMRAKIKKGKIRICALVHLKKSDVMQYRTGVGGVDFYSLIWYEFM